MNIKPTCRACNKKHAGQCRAGLNVCYKCGLPGHIIKTCPKSRQLVISRTYVMTTDQANPDPTAGTDYKMSGRGRGRGRCGERRGSTIEKVSSGGPACVIVVITPPVEQLVRQSSQESGHSSGQGPSHGNSQKGFRHKQKRQDS
ncbi:hypothetical protein F511_25716 [Dorcoceras hygrometricum]|uniref:CCHC-type domain-containing protein n=1 Tax=Dorcoceras hygrometricum TaxID=472368 RepID=A0A2Z7A9P6_9LAMI|nr:hypothetical protein F511_25716 [Dorcoceras hygrometricum]